MKLSNIHTNLWQAGRTISASVGYCFNANINVQDKPRPLPGQHDADSR